MRYLMLVCVDPDDTGQPEGAPDIEEWVSEMDQKGLRVLGSRTRPASDATTVRVRDGRVLLTDGPYAEARDVIGGFDILDCADLDEAIEVAAKHPMAWAGVIELRPFWPFEEKEEGKEEGEQP
ncbi:YciI family protein [Actinoplanes sp. NPDC051851]|uniref:YciI family protein n=1 Tax=Actinoplanes sp. NPDC051851 TaxID=3154753 RepID=UPI0034419472